MIIKQENSIALTQIKTIGLLHFLGNIFSGGLLGTLLVVAYLMLNNNIERDTKKVIYDIINFNLSFMIYLAIAALSLLILIGFIALPVGALLWFIFLVIGFIKHLAGDGYKYPMTIEFLK